MIPGRDPSAVAPQGNIDIQFTLMTTGCQHWKERAAHDVSSVHARGEREIETTCDSRTRTSGAIDDSGAHVTTLHNARALDTSWLATTLTGQRHPRGVSPHRAKRVRDSFRAHSDQRLPKRELNQVPAGLAHDYEVTDAAAHILRPLDQCSIGSRLLRDERHFVSRFALKAEMIQWIRAVAGPDYDHKFWVRRRACRIAHPNGVSALSSAIT